MSFHKLVFLGALLCATGVEAQQACPGGTQVGQNCGGGYCVPICAYDESPRSAQAAPAPRVVERWEVFDDRYGAVAIDQAGPYGASSGERSLSAAAESAIAQCEKRGGRKCRVIGDHKNMCSTYAWGGGRAIVEGDLNAHLSEQRALERCERSSGVPCDVIETVCSKPVSRWVYEKPDNFVPAR